MIRRGKRARCHRSAAPYLWDLVRADPARALRILCHDPHETLTALSAPRAKPRRRRMGRAS